MDLANKIAIVTGGVSGIGKEIVIALLENRIQHVAIFDINEENGRKVCLDLVLKYGDGRVMMIMTDVTNKSSFEDAFQMTLNIFKRVDILINNVGIINEIQPEIMINANLKSNVEGNRLGIKYMSKANGGHGGVILNIASLTSFLTFYALPVYAATKSALVHLARCYGHPYNSDKTGVSVMALCPGYTAATSLFSNNCASKESIEAMEEFVKTEKTQMPESVGRSAVEVIKTGTTGSIWIIDGGDLYKYNIPDLESCMELVKEKV